MQSARDESIPFLLKEEDAPELAALESACFALPPERRSSTENSWAATLRSRKKTARAPPPLPTGPAGEPLAVLPATPVFGPRAANGELAAYVRLGVYRAIQEMEIYNIAVRDSFRRKGWANGCFFTPWTRGAPASGESCWKCGPLMPPPWPSMLPPVLPCADAAESITRTAAKTRLSWPATWNPM